MNTSCFALKVCYVTYFLWRLKQISTHSKENPNQNNVRMSSNSTLMNQRVYYWMRGLFAGVEMTRRQRLHQKSTTALVNNTIQRY